MSDKTLLICGGDGLLGPYVRKAFEDKWQVISSSRNSNHHPCDFTDEAAVENLLHELKPDAVIHLIAITNVDACEENIENARVINAATVKNIVSVLDENVPLIYVSTDQVYPDSKGPHLEGATAPLNSYGCTKLEGEVEVLKHSRALALRINLFGPSLTKGRTSLSDFFIKAFTDKADVTLFDDVLFSPLHMGTIGVIMRKSIDLGLGGVYNLGSREGMSKADFAFALADHLGLNASHAKIGQSTAIEGRAHRAKDLRMDVTRIENALGMEMPTLQEEIEKL